MPTGLRRNTSNEIAPTPKLLPRVLLADDDVAARRLIAALIRQLGFDVQIVANGEEALDCIRSNRYDIVVLDIDMPLVDGIEAALTIRAATEAAAEVKIVAMSGFSNEFMAGRDLSGLFDATITKPVTKFRLQDTIFTLLQTNSEADQRQTA